MIFVGTDVEWLNCAGARAIDKYFFTANDYHEASEELIKYNHSNGYTCQRVLNAEFHDTKTGRTWNVDSRGHTQKNYYYESDNDFKERW